MPAAVKTAATFSYDVRRPPFQTRIRPTYPPFPVDYDVTSDAQRFFIRGARAGTSAVISICRELERAVEAEALNVLVATTRHLMSDLDTLTTVVGYLASTATRSFGPDANATSRNPAAATACNSFSKVSRRMVPTTRYSMGVVSVTFATTPTVSKL